MKVSNYTKVFPHRDGYLILYSLLTTATALIEKDEWARASDGDLPGKDLIELADMGFLTADPEEGKRKVWQLPDERNENNPLVSAVLVMNLDCNLSCIYCYEGGMKGKFYMDRDTADRFVRFIEKQFLPHKKLVNIDFFGGEPLLSLELIKYISRKVQDIASQRGLDYGFTLVTNGTLLTKKVVDDLIPLGFRGARITIDGPKDNHDVHRPFKTGKGSFDLIIENIKQACERIKIAIGGNFRENNYKRFPELLDFLMHNGLTPDKLSAVKFDPVTSSKKKSHITDFKDGCMSINEPWIMESSVLLREEILMRGFHTPQVEPSSCMVYSNSHFVVGHDGYIYKCPGFIGMKEFRVGTLEDGASDYRLSYSLDSWKNGECMDCEYLPHCFGGCRYMKVLRGETLEGVDCKKQYLDATLEKFIKQDIIYRIQ